MLYKLIRAHGLKTSTVNGFENVHVIITLTANPVSLAWPDLIPHQGKGIGSGHNPVCKEGWGIPCHYMASASDCVA